MNYYEMKQERRRQRFEDAADRARRDAEAQHKRSHDLVKDIPLGQPILVGHHSERGHRRTLDRSWNALGKAVAASERAEEMARKAEAVGTAGVSSDDPDAVAKLSEQLKTREERQAFMVAANKVVRAFYKAGGTVVAEVVGGEPAAWTALLEKLRALYPAITEAQAAELLKPDFCGRTGFPDYALSNNKGNIKRLRERIGFLQDKARVREALAAEGAGPVVTEVGKVRIVENVEINRLQMIFPGKPPAEIRDKLKSYGFRWSPTEGAWQRHLSNAAKYAAETIAKEVV